MDQTNFSIASFFGGFDFDHGSFHPTSLPG
jgi:hypothetical protein